MSASADVLAMAKAEIDLSAIPEGKNVWAICNAQVLEWRTNSSLGYRQMARQTRFHSPQNRR
jgi:hypothetical protein